MCLNTLGESRALCEVRWWLVWVSMDLFTHYRPHRQDSMCMPCVSLLQTSRDWSDASHCYQRGQEVVDLESFQETYSSVQLHQVASRQSVYTVHATTKTCNRNNLPAGGPSLAMARERHRQKDWKSLHLCIIVYSVWSFYAQLWLEHPCKEKTKLMNY